MSFAQVPPLRVSPEAMRRWEVTRLPYRKRIPRKVKKRLKRSELGVLKRDAEGFYLDRHIRGGVVIRYT